jgi:hypothetical protein
VVVWVAATNSHAEYLNEGWDTTDVVRAEEGYPKASIALASADGDAVTALALLTKGTPVATATNRVRLSNIEAIAEPISFATSCHRRCGVTSARVCCRRAPGRSAWPPSAAFAPSFWGPSDTSARYSPGGDSLRHRPSWRD